jgi:aspartate/methionine/tyrosine aminotransferase
MVEIQLSGIKKMEAFAQQNSDVISLSQGGLKIDGIPVEIRAHLQQQLFTNHTDYYGPPVGIPALRQILAQKLNQRYGTHLNMDSVMVSHGAGGALATIFLTLLDQGDEVIIPEPSYPAYENLAYVAKAKPVFVSMKQTDPSIESTWALSIENIVKAITPRTKIVVISNPANPLGIFFGEKVIKDLARICQERGIYLITDEVYDDYVFGDGFYSSVPLIESNSHVIRVSSFSKNFSMSGWRVGYLVYSESFRKALEAVQDTLIVCPSVLSQHAALYAMNHPELAARNHAMIHENLRLVHDMLLPLKEKNIISFEKPTAAFYFFIKTNHPDNEALCLDIVKKARVALIPGMYFGPSGVPFIRLCYARKQSLLAEALNRLVAYWSNAL